MSCVCYIQSVTEVFINNFSEFLSNPYLHPSVYEKHDRAALEKRLTDRFAGMEEKEKTET